MGNCRQDRFLTLWIGLLFFLGIILSGPLFAIAREKKTVAVITFQNFTGDNHIDWIGEGVADEIRRKLSYLKELRILSPGDLQSTLTKLADWPARTINPAKLSAIREATEADWVIAGGYQRSGDELSISVYTISSQAQPIPSPLEVSGEVRSIFALINNLIQSIPPLLGISPSDVEKDLLLKNMTDNLNAFVFYSRSWKPLLTDDNDTAIAYCREAIKADPYYEPALDRLIEIHERLEKWPEAVKLYYVMEKIAIKEKDNKKLMDIYEKFIHYYSLNNDYKIAGKYNNFIVDILAKEKDLEGVYKKYIEIAETYMKRGMRDQPIKFYLKALEVQKELRDYAKIGDTYQSLGEVFVLKEMDRPALRYFNKALSIRKKTRNNQALPYTMTSIGEIKLRKRKFSKAKKLLRQALKMAEENNDGKLTARIHYNYGLLHFFSLKYKKALKSYEKALSIQGKNADTSLLIDTYDNIGTIYSNEEKHEKALEYYRKTLALRKKAGLQLAMGQATLKIANVLSEQEKFEEALYNYQEAHSLLREKGSKRDIALIYSQMGSIYENNKDFVKALEWYQNSVQVQRILDDEVGLAGTYFRIGHVYEKIDQLKKAIRYIEKTVELDKKNRDPNLGEDRRYLKRLKQKADSLLKKKDWNKVVSDALASPQTIENPESPGL